MSIRPVSGKIEAQVINDNLSFLDSKEVNMSSLGQDVREALVGGPTNIPVVGVDAVGTTNVRVKAITPSRTNFLDAGKNKFDESEISVGIYVDPSTGMELANANLNTSAYIPMNSMEDWVVSIMRFLVFYNTNKQYISGVNNSTPVNNYTFKTPAAGYFRFSFPKDSTNIQLEKGTTPTEFERFGYSFTDLINIDNKGEEEDYFLTIPANIYSTKNKKLTIFNNNILKDPQTDKGLKLWYKANVGRNLETKYEYPEAVTNSQMSIELYDNDRLLCKKTSNIIVSENRQTKITALLIGDSTVRTNGTGLVTQRVIDNLSDKIEFIGTMGSGVNKWEGRGGWSAETYRTNAAFEGVANPFYNPTKNDFDFSHYMETQSFTNVDVVGINLGINDMWGFTSENELKIGITKCINNFDYIINSILTFNSNIKVFIHLPIPPSSNQNMFGFNFGNAQVRWRYKNNNFELVRALIEKFSNKPRINLVPIHLGINESTNYVDHVHPNEEGYQVVGDTLTAYLNSL